MGAPDRIGLGSYVALDALRIAVIDDSAYFRNIVSTMLKAFGVRHVFEGATEEQAFGVLTALRPDILLLDWNLGTGGNGASLIERIRTHADERLATVAVVLVTAYGARRHVLMAAGFGANALLLKPVSPRSLYDRLAHLVTQRQLYEHQDGRFRPIVNAPRHEVVEPGAIRIQAPRLDWLVKKR